MKTTAKRLLCQTTAFLRVCHFTTSRSAPIKSRFELIQVPFCSSLKTYTCLDFKRNFIKKSISERCQNCSHCSHCSHCSRIYKRKFFHSPTVTVCKMRRSVRQPNGYPDFHLSVRHFQKHSNTALRNGRVQVSTSIHVLRYVDPSNSPL